MSEKRKEEYSQLSFDLGDEKRDIWNHTENFSCRTNNIVTFIDSRTLAVRRAAIRRVAEAEIFKPFKTTN